MLFQSYMTYFLLEHERRCFEEFFDCSCNESCCFEHHWLELYRQTTYRWVNDEKITIHLSLHTALCQRLWIIMAVGDPVFRPHKETEEVLEAKQENETDSATLVLWDERKYVSDVTVPPNAHLETLLVSVKIIWASIFWKSCWVKRFYSRIKNYEHVGGLGSNPKAFP